MGPDRTVSFLMTLSDPLTRVSMSRYTYKSTISKTVHFRDKVTKEHYQETMYNLSNGTTLNDLE